MSYRLRWAGLGVVVSLAVLGLAGCDLPTPAPASDNTPLTSTSATPTEPAPTTSTTAATTTSSEVSRVTLSKVEPPQPPAGYADTDLCVRTPDRLKPPSSAKNLVIYEQFRPVGHAIFDAAYIDGHVAIQRPFPENGVAPYPHWVYRNDAGRLVADTGADPTASTAGAYIAAHYDAWAKAVVDGAPACYDLP
jgi:hypothetical protein